MNTEKDNTGQEGRRAGRQEGKDKGIKDKGMEHKAMKDKNRTGSTFYLIFYTFLPALLPSCPPALSRPIQRKRVWGLSILLLLLLFFFTSLSGQSIRFGLLKYSGGGDWYVNPTSLPNLIRYCNETMGTDIAKEPITVEPGSRDLFSVPFVHMTGHGNVLFSPQEAENLRQYLIGGGFLHIDDNYGLDQFARQEMKKVFPELEFVELPVSHPIFLRPNPFPDGIPKIHEHDNKRPQAFGLIWENRLVCLFSYESDLGDGWEDPQVHNDSPETRLKALKMGANLIRYVFTEK